MARRIPPEIKARLIELFHRGLTPRVAALTIGVPKGTVDGYWWRQGLRRTRANLDPNEAKKLIAKQREKDKGRPRHTSRAAPKPKVAYQLPPLEVLFANPADKRAGR